MAVSYLKSLLPNPYQSLWMKRTGKASSCNLSHQSILALMFMTPDSRNGQSTEIYPLVSPVSLPTTASGTTANLVIPTIDTGAILPYYAFNQKGILVKGQYQRNGKVINPLYRLNI